MKKAALVCVLLGLGLGLDMGVGVVWAAGAGGTAEQGGGDRGLGELSGTIIASAKLAKPRSPEAMGFTLAEPAASGGYGLRAGFAAGAAGPANGTSAQAAQALIPALGPVAVGSNFDPDIWAAAPVKAPEVASPGVIRGTSGEPAVSWAVFRGKKNGDVFTSLHEEYAWRMNFKSMTLGLGFYRSIPLGKGVRIKPYVGVIRSSLSLRPAGLNATNELYEYQLTAFCIGLPLVFGF